MFPAMPFSRFSDWKYALSIALIALVVLRIGAELTGRGAPYWHLDFKTLSGEQARFYERVYPHTAVAPRRAGEKDVRSDYPPSSFPLFIPWLPPGAGASAATGWFMTCQGIAVLMLLGFAWREGRPEGTVLAVTLAAAVLAMTGLRADLLFGNLAAITVALLLAMWQAAERDRWWLAALLWSAAMVKPQIGWLFALLFLRRGAWPALAAAAGLLVALALAACAWTHVTLGDILRPGYDSNLSAITQLTERNSLVNLLVQAGIPWHIALAACAGAGLAIAAWALRGPLAHVGTVPRFAVIGIVNRLCTYHNACDDLLLIFALAWLGRRAWCSPRLGDWGAFLALGFTVWAPAVALQLVAVKILVVTIWVVIAIWITLRPEFESRDSSAV